MILDSAETVRTYHHFDCVFFSKLNFKSVHEGVCSKLLRQNDNFVPIQDLYVCMSVTFYADFFGCRSMTLCHLETVGIWWRGGGEGARLS